MRGGWLLVPTNSVGVGGWELGFGNSVSRRRAGWWNGRWKLVEPELWQVEKGMARFWCSELGIDCSDG